LQIRFDDAVKAPTQRVALPAWHHIEAKADELDDRALAGATCPDETIEAVRKFDVGSVKEAAEDAKSPDAMESGVLHVAKLILEKLLRRSPIQFGPHM